MQHQRCLRTTVVMFFVDHRSCGRLTLTGTLVPKKIFWAQNTDETVTPLQLLANGSEAKWSFKTERKLKSPLGVPRITEQPQRHGSSARLSAWGACWSYGTIPRKSFRSPGPFLVVSHYTIWTHGHNPSNTSYDPCPPGQLGAGRLHYRCACICVAHGKYCRLFSATR